MSETNSDWNDLKFFLAVARHSGLSGAARQTGLSAATLGRRMQALEQATGIEIFRRHARGYDLTEQGEALFARVAALDAEVRPLFDRQNMRPLTLVKLSGGHWTLHALAPHIPQIAKSAPDAMLRLISATDHMKINHREAVIGIRNQRPERTGLACRKVGTVAFAGYATDDAVQGWIRVTSKAPSARWLADQIDTEITLEANAPRLARDLALQGLGRVILPCFIGERTPGLVRVHPRIRDLDHEQWLVSHDEDRFIPAVRKVLDATYTALGLILKTSE
ncbi:LysR family transcriptional regulator [Sulfitobacter sp. S190]|uniref:LysR family transcriptional regulator n=1 Tax=Sulfitobacter sp. S190 TaxID=2867022 RepID=UPI0021A87C70|nr:LysR family transcriptional regulator [Sulfitobacter sp. S190]UWR21770.1 LysR family transcriptional regulator [Sulfitobacter sp. S190]